MNEQLEQTGFQAGSKTCSNCGHRGGRGWENGACRACSGYPGGYSHWSPDHTTLDQYIKAIQKAEKDPECRLGDSSSCKNDSDLNSTPVPNSNDFDAVSNPSHYTEGRKIEPIDAITDWELNFCLGNVVKYVSRAGRKNNALEDLKKARFYLDYHIKTLEM